MDKIRFLRQKFGEYYATADIYEPPEIYRREFGFGINKKIDYRHESFPTKAALQTYLKSRGPLYVSYSTAYYEIPNAHTMENKGYLKSEFVIDLDDPGKGDNYYEKLEYVKEDAAKCIDLLGELGFKPSLVNFSGSKGYHIHIEKNLSPKARQEVADYLNAKGLEMQIVKENKSNWAEKINAYFKKIISEENKEFFKKAGGFGPKTIEGILAKKEAIISSEKPLIYLPDKKIEAVVRQIVWEIAPKIDAMVLIDKARLIRLPETLHGGSSLKAAIVKNLDTFDPLRDAVAFGNEEMKVDAKANEFTLKDETWGPFDGIVSVPEFVGLYLIAKGKANPVEQNMQNIF